MIDEYYNPQQLEKAVAARWQERGHFHASEDLNKEKFYCLAMFPYPSGQLHVGHVRNYVISDVIARYQRLSGKNVLQPIGWDAFGLPAENAAIAHEITPAAWTEKNIANMRQQLQQLGLAYDWDRELNTSKPDYYRWEQWLFLKMYEKGLVYRKKAIVNWDPIDQTVLANEQVVNGRGWRSGAVVERREIPQWFVKITSYADQLLDDLDQLDWPERVKTMQRNWIGRSEGAEVTFTVDDHPPMTVFTTRADTLMGATYLAIAPEHALAKEAAEKDAKIHAFLEACQKIKVAEADIATMEKRGIASGFYANHPLSGEKLPIWIANYVLLEYGEGAVMAVPAHDQRDFEFAKKYQLPIKQVVAAKGDVNVDDNCAFCDNNGTLIHSGEYDGLNCQKGSETIINDLISKGLGKQKTHYRLRDWGISRQRYWGTPIPFVHCDTCGIVPVNENDLPIVLPEDVTFNGATSPLKEISKFYQISCPKCKKPAHRETDTLDTFVESSWYFTRFACPQQEKAILDDRAKYWTPVDQYIGGIEHAVMHLLYARFIHKVLRDLGFVNSDEPFKQLLTQGMVLKDGAKMSKSKGNTVNPQTLIDHYGADTLRLFAIFAAPPTQSLEWSDNGVEGAYRFLNRLWKFAHDHQEIIKEEGIAHKTGSPQHIDWQTAPPLYRNHYREIHLLLKQVTQDMKRHQLNTVASHAMKLLNLLQQVATDSTNNPTFTASLNHLIYEGFAILLQTLHPIAPHITYHLWREMTYRDASGIMGWPKVDPQALKMDTVEIIVQVNGKLRGKIETAVNAERDALEALAKNDSRIEKYLSGKTIKKIIVVPNKLMNIVVTDPS
ncbi:MAG: leucine--tRNA ligase [Gammaproteobacteria bacterium]|nr:leucine--tRNA ligase [Gammaproteobacteria bacterium]